MQERQPRRIKQILSWAEFSLAATGTLGTSWASLNQELAIKLSEGSPLGVAQLIKISNDAGIPPQVTLGGIIVACMIGTVDAYLRLRREDRK